MEYIIREAKRDDMPYISHLGTVTWYETYQGIVPDWYLKKRELNEMVNILRIVYLKK